MEEKKISAKDLAAHICKQMPAEKALSILLANQVTHYEKLKIDKQPADNPETVSPYFIIVAAAMDMGWGIMMERGKDTDEVKGLSIGTDEYLKGLIGYKITGEELGGLLFGIHSHAGSLAIFDDKGTEDHIANPDQIIYKEDDLLPILKAMGLPDPIWGNVLKLEDYKKSKKM